MIVHIKRQQKESRQTYISLKPSFHQFSKNQHFKDRMKLKKIWPLEDKILIFGQALAKTYLLLHLLMDNELVCLC